MRAAQDLYEKLLAAAPSNDEQSASRFLYEHQLHEAFAFDLAPTKRDEPYLRVAACLHCSAAVAYVLPR